MKKVLLAGESWMTYTTHVKGFDSFYTSSYATGEKYLAEALRQGGYDFEFMPNHVAMQDFPHSLEELKSYNAIILSDIGANTLLLQDQTFVRSEITTNRCDLLAEYVRNGGALLMIGGYLSFAGIDGKGKWHDNAVQSVLPVEVQTVDDRREHPEGIRPKSLLPQHPILKGIPDEWPLVLGYNQCKIKAEAELIATIGGDPFIAAVDYGKGRSAIVSTDCSPHWAPPEFCKWPYYNLLWQNLLAWLCEKQA